MSIQGKGQWLFLWMVQGPEGVNFIQTILRINYEFLESL